MNVFFLGLLWFFLISMQTRIVAFTDHYLLHAVWTFLVSIVWVFLIRQIMLTTSVDEAILYAAGTSVGSVLATSLHAAWRKRKGEVPP